MKHWSLGLLVAVSTQVWGGSLASPASTPEAPSSPPTSSSDHSTTTTPTSLTPSLKLLGEVIVSDTRVPLWKVGQVVGEASSIEQFVFEKQHVLREMGEQVKSQVCATICQHLASSNEFGMTVTTVKARAHCPVVSVCPNGMIETTWSVHTHDKEPDFSATPVDRLFGEKERVVQEPNMFSKKDLQKSFLFLVAPDVVLLFDTMNLKVVRDTTSPVSAPKPEKMVSMEDTKHKTTP